MDAAKTSLLPWQSGLCPLGPQPGGIQLTLDFSHCVPERKQLSARSYAQETANVAFVLREVISLH